MQLKNWNPDTSGIEFRTRPDLKFYNWKIEIRMCPGFEIRTCPDLKSGRVQIWNLANEKLKSGLACNWNTDIVVEKFCQSGFFFSNWKIEIRTCPDLLFSNWRIKLRMCPDIYFEIRKEKSGLDSVIEINKLGNTRVKLKSQVHFESKKILGPKEC